jgi:microcystin-dependent protein
MGYLTPDTAPGNVQCRALFVPDSEEFLAIVRGALQELTFAHNWTKFGALTPDQAAASFVDMFDAFCLEKAACRMIGEIVTYAGSTSPNSNWLVCDGSEVAQADYPDLYNVIGDTYGAASADHFKLPDLCGRAPAGVGTGSSLSPVTLGQQYGEEKHTLTVSEMPSHSHSDAGHMHTVGNSFTFLALTGEEPVLMPNPIPAWTGSASANIRATGGGSSHNTVGPRLGLTFLIVAKDG